MKLTKYADLSEEARENSILMHHANSDMYAVYRFIDSIARTMSYGHDKPISPERVIRLAGQLIDVINADIDDYDATNTTCYVAEE